MSIEKITNEKIKVVSPVLDLVKTQAEDLKRFAEANGINIVIVLADQKEYEKDKIAMCQMGHVSQENTDLKALMALDQNLEKAKDLVEQKIVLKLVQLMDKGEMPYELDEEEKKKLTVMKAFFDRLQTEEPAKQTKE